MAFYIGDIPADVLVIEPPETITLDEFDTAAAGLIPPAGGTAVPVDADIDLAEGAVLVDFPDADSILTEAGIYRLRIVLTSIPNGYQQQLPDLPLVVQDDGAGWHNLDSIRAEWPDAEAIPDWSLFALLEVARDQCVAFAPALADDAPVPTRYREAQRIQARNVWNAARVAPDGTVGQDDFIIRPFPLDWHVKAILRPKRGIPVIG